MLAGEVGIPSPVEDQIWQRDRSRVLADVNRTRDEVMSTFAARGFPLPPGAAAHAVRLAQADANDKIAMQSRDVAIKHVDILIENSRVLDIVLNQYVLLEAGEKQTMPARMSAGGKLVRLQIPEALKIQDGTALKPMNLGQRCLIDALLNPDISLVTCYGQAGTGKTLVAVAAGLHEMFNRRYNGLTVSRPVVAMGDQLGFLPGTLDEKMRPWLQPIHDALDLLMRPVTPLGPRRKQPKADNGGPGGPVKKPWEILMDQGIIEVEALCYIRGRSIPNRFFVLDEAQQLTPQEAKTVVTRMSRGSKLVLVGDPAQIDNPYVDSRSNGLVYTRNRLKGPPFVAHVSLSRGERSELADAGAQLM